MMDRVELADRKNVSVKAANDEQIGVNDRVKKFQTNYPEKPFAKTRELHQVKRDTNQLNESRKIAESARVEAKSELLAAKEKVKDLTLRIEETNARAERQVVDLEKLKMGKTTEAELRTGDSEREKVIRELESVKRELSKLKLDMASVMEEKKKAELETRDSVSKRESYLSSVHSLNTKIEKVNEEHVLVELARIEAIKEYGEIEAQVREKAESYSTEIDEARKEKQTMIDEIEDAKELETKLAITISDINMLQSEIKQVREMDTGLERNEIVKYQVNEEGESGSASLLESVTKELEDTKKELALVKEESFQFMASMDVIRNELRHVAAQTARLKKKEQKSEMTIQNLNSKLLRAKVKLDEASAAEDEAKSIASNLSLALEQVKSEAERECSWSQGNCGEEDCSCSGLGRSPEKLKPGYGLPTKAMNKSIKRTPMRRGKAWRSASPVVHGTPRSTTFTVRRRRKVMPNIAKFFRGKSTEKNP